MTEQTDDRDHDHPRRGVGSGPTAALWERVDNHAAMIRSLAEETTSQFRDFRSETASQINSLAASTSQQITSVAAQVEKVAGKFDAYASRVSDSQRPQYLGIIGAMFAAITVTVTIISVLSNLHDRPVDDKLTAQSQQIADLTKNTAQAFAEAAKATVSQSEYRLTTDFTNRISDLKTAGNLERVGKLQSQVDKLNEDVVPRAEHQFHWNAEAKTDDHLEAEISALQQRVDNLAPAGDLLKRLGDREHELELRVFGAKPLPPG